MIFDHILPMLHPVNVQVDLLLFLHLPLRSKRAFRDRAVMPGKRIDHARPHIVDAHIIAVHPLDKSAGSEGKRLFEQLIAAHPEIIVFQHLAHPLLQLLSLDADLDLLVERQIRPVLRNCLRHAEAAPLARQLSFAVILPIRVKCGNFSPIPRLPDIDAFIRRIRRAAEATRP